MASSINLSVKPSEKYKCIACIFRQITQITHFVWPLRFYCQHNKKGQTTADIKISRRVLIVSYIINLCIFLFTSTYVYLMWKHCGINKIECLLITTEFIFSFNSNLYLFLVLLSINHKLNNFKKWGALIEEVTDIVFDKSLLKIEFKNLQTKNIVFQCCTYSGLVVLFLGYNYVFIDLLEFQHLRQMCLAFGFYNQAILFGEMAQESHYLLFLGSIFNKTLRKAMIKKLSLKDKIYYFSQEKTVSQEDVPVGLYQIVIKMNKFLNMFVKNLQASNSVYNPMLLIWIMSATTLLTLDVYLIVIISSDASLINSKMIELEIETIIIIIGVIYVLRRLEIVSCMVRYAHIYVNIYVNSTN